MIGKSIKNSSSAAIGKDTFSVNMCWIGGVPAHYMREMHRRAESVLGNEIFFLYLEKQHQSPDRDYEKGAFPTNCIFVDSGNWASIWKELASRMPQKVLLAGHFPRSIMIGLLWARLRKRRVAYCSDTNILDMERRPWVRRSAEIIFKRIFFKWVDHFLYLGTRNRDFYELVVGRKYLEGRLFKFPYPALTYSAIVWNNSPDQAIQLLYIGRLVPNKCVDRLISALLLLPDHYRGKVKLTVVGDGPEREKLESLVEEREIGDRVTFLGAVPSNELESIYREHDVFVLPSELEPWGLVVNEALSAGLPVIAPYWVGAAADLVIDGFTGFVLEDNQPETIMEEIVRATKLSKKGLSKMGAAGAELVDSGGFNIDYVTQKFIEYTRFPAL